MKATLPWALFCLASTCLLRPAEAPVVLFKHVVIDAKPPDNPWIKIVGDLNGDDKPDIIIGGSKGPLVWYRNPDWQRFLIATGGYDTVAGAVADIDRDGDLDLALGGVVWFENPRPKAKPSEDLWPAHQVDNRRGHDLLAADLDGDGKVDLIMRDQSSFGAKAGQSIFLYKQITPMQWTMRELRCGEGEGLQVAGLNADGKPDIVIGGSWFENSGDLLRGPWTEHVFTTQWNYPHAKVAAGDLNADGRLDIALAPAELKGGSHRLAWYEAPANPKSGNWKQHIIEEPVETVVHALARADFNGDGKLDLVAARMHQGNSPQEVVVYLNTGVGLAWKRQVIATTGSHDVVAADIDGDGFPDILGANHGGPFQPVELWLNRPAARAPARGPLRVLPANPRYFTDDGRRAVYLTGAHTWDNLQDMGEANVPAAFDFNGYLDFLGKHGHNFVRLWRWELLSWDTPANDEKTARHLVVAPHPWARTGPGQALDGKPRFNLDQFDDAYFNRLRSRVAAARDRGIYVSVMLFESWGVQHAANGWKTHPFHPDNNIDRLDADTDHDGRGLEVNTLRVPVVTKVQEACARKVVDTLNDLDNVLYEISNEAGAYSTDWQEHFIHFIRNYEKGKPKQHPVGMTFQYARDPKQRGSNTTLFRSSADWISPNPGAGPFNYSTNPPPADGQKVILADTDHLWGIGGDVAWVWKSFIRGLNPIFMDPYKQEVLQGGADSKWEPVRRAMGVTRRLADRVNLAAMIPRGELASSGYCLANPAREYLVYLPEGDEVKVDLSGAAGEFQVEWIHPVEGQVIASPAVSGGASAMLKSPQAGATVLHLNKK